MAIPSGQAQRPATAAERRLMLRQDFDALRNRFATDWEMLALEALLAPRSLYNLAASKAAPSWTEAMAASYLQEVDFERWTLLPRVAEVTAFLYQSENIPLTPLAPRQQCAALGTTSQYRVVRAAALDDVFARLKDAYGSKYYFHGSLLTSWHQIIVQGLEPKSGTSMQRNGAARGRGLYVASTSSLSADFMGETPTRVLGIVEVVNHPSIASDRNAFIVPSRAFAAVRFVAIYKEFQPVPDVAASTIDTHVRQCASLSGSLAPADL